MRSFEATARLLSFTAASREIDLTQTAVSQHIKALDTQLGNRLFICHPQSLHLTDIGIKLVIAIWKSPSEENPVDVDIVLTPQQHARPDLELLSDETLVPISNATTSPEVCDPGIC